MHEADATQAAAFIAALTGTDGWTTPVTFQTFADSGEHPELAHIYNGSLTQHAETLRSLNLRGAGVFLTIQQTNLKGRRADCITAARAAFIDADDHEERTFALPPSITVRTPNGRHDYWLLEEGQPLTELPDIQKDLAAWYQADTSVTDLPRVMRLPGFSHCKGEPSPVTLTHARPLHYTFAQLRAAHPVSRPVVKPVTLPRVDSRDGEHRRFRAWATYKPVSCGMRHKTAYSIAAEGLKRGIDTVSVCDVVREYCIRAGLGEPDVLSVMSSAVRARTRAS